MRPTSPNPGVVFFRFPAILVIVLLMGCGSAFKSKGGEEGVEKAGKAPVKVEKSDLKAKEAAEKAAAKEEEAKKKAAKKAKKVAKAEGEKKEEAKKVEKEKVAKAKKPVPRSSLPCDPVMVSGITGECAGTGAPGGFAGEAFKAGLSEHPIALEESQLPKDRFGLIDWGDSIKSGAVKPLGSLDPEKKDTPPFDMDVVVYTKSQFMPDVIYPHKVHTMWLTCTNCHPSIFPMNAKQANAMMTMPLIAAGEFCGKCHNRVAFPLSDCERCHIKPRNVPPIDPDAAKWNITPIQIPD